MGSDSLLQGDFSTTLGATARAGGHAACSTSTFQGALEMTGRNLGILRSRIQKLFGGWMRIRDIVGDAAKRRPNEPCSGATG